MRREIARIRGDGDLAAALERGERTPRRLGPVELPADDVVGDDRVDRPWLEERADALRAGLDEVRGVLDRLVLERIDVDRVGDLARPPEVDDHLALLLRQLLGQLPSGDRF